MQQRAHPRAEPAPVGGFTMVELLVAMLVITVSLCGLAALQLRTIQAVTVSRQAHESTRLAQATLERFRAMAYARVKEQESNDWVVTLNGKGLPMRRVAVDGSAAGPYTVQQLVEDRSGGAKTRYAITVRVTWVGATTAGATPPPVQSVWLTTQRFE